MTRNEHKNEAAELKLTTNEQLLLAELRAAAESAYGGDDWVEVYLDNCETCQRDPRLFAALTGSLAKKNYYRPHEPAWGLVRLDD